MTTARIRRMIAVLLALIAMAPAAATAAERTITITVTVLDPAGDPIENIGVEAVGLFDRDFGLTTSQGIIDLQMDVSDGEPPVGVRLWHGAYHEKTPHESLNNRYIELATTLWAPPLFLVQPHPGLDQYALTIQAEPAVRMTLAPVDDQGQPIPAGAFIWTSLDDGNAALAGESITLPGVRRGHPSKIIITRTRPGFRGEHHIYELSAATTVADADLGAIAIPALARDASLHLTVAGARDAYTHIGFPLDYAVALVSADFDVILTFPLNDAGVALHDENSPPIPVPSGTWWIVPGAVTPDLTMAVYDALRAGGAGALDAAAVPKVTLAPGETATISINAPETRDAIYAATGGPPAPDAP